MSTLDTLAERTAKLDSAISALSSRLSKFNPYHDAKGRFSSGRGGGAALGANLKSGNKPAALKRIGGLLTNARNLDASARARGDYKTSNYAKSLHGTLLKAQTAVNQGRFKTARSVLIRGRAALGV